MSETVKSKGFIAVLQNPITNWDALEDKNEELSHFDSSLRVNYDGTLIFSDKPSDLYGIEFGTSDARYLQQFIEDCAKVGVPVVTTTVRPYSCVWYNGSDSDMIS